MRLLAVCLVALAADARADGYFYEQSYGIATAPDANMLGTTLRLRLGFGVRVGRLSLEPWFAALLAFDRVDASYGVIGGQPAAGHSDLGGYGFDLKYTQPLPDHFGLYVRGGPRASNGEGALDHYAGYGFGGGAGVQLSGRVRALGFLWAPLFFLKRGPHVTGALFLDESVDMYWLTAPQMPAVATPVVSTNLGFAIGSEF